MLFAAPVIPNRDLPVAHPPRACFEDDLEAVPGTHASVPPFWAPSQFRPATILLVSKPFLSHLLSLHGWVALFVLQRVFFMAPLFYLGLLSLTPIFGGEL